MEISGVVGMNYEEIFEPRTCGLRLRIICTNMILLLCYISSRLAVDILAATHLRLTHVGPCDDVMSLPFTLGELAIKTQAIQSTLSGEFNLTRDVENGWKVKATMQKCQDLRNVDTCDFLSEFDLIRDGCGYDEDEEEIYGMIFHYAKPELDCPIQAGRYKLMDYPFFIEDNFLAVSETKISTSVFGYTLRLNGYAADAQRIFCVESYLQLMYMRNHDWLERPHNKTKHQQQSDEETNE